MVYAGIIVPSRHCVADKLPVWKVLTNAVRNLLSHTGCQRKQCLEEQLMYCALC